MELTYLMDSVRQDHALLCGELAVFKKAEDDDSPSLWQTLRDVCARLSVGLLKHMRREDRMRIQPSSDHYSDYRYLQVITRCIASENSPFLLNNRYHLLKGFLRGLHLHMEKQEADLFPVLEPAMAYVVAEVEPRPQEEADVREHD